MGVTKSAWLFGSLIALGACVENDKKPVSAPLLSAENQIVIMRRVGDCERQAADRVDDRRSSISTVADQVMGMCTPERLKARQAFRLRMDDPDIDQDELKRAVDIVEDARWGRNSN